MKNSFGFLRNRRYANTTATKGFFFFFSDYNVEDG